MTTAPTSTRAIVTGQVGTLRKDPRQRNLGAYVFLTVMAIMWLVPLVWTLYTSLRPYADTAKHGYFSFSGTFDIQNYINAWNQGGFTTYFTNSVIYTVPTVILTLFLASLMAFALSRYSWPFNLTLLVMFTAGNLLPPQVLATPLFETFRLLQLPYWMSDSGTLLNTYVSVIAVNTALQVGFCTFVLSNYMKALPTEISEAARVDGAGVWRHYWSIVMPLSRPALAALATLEVIFIYNDFFWPLIFIQSGNRLPVTTAINNLKGEWLTNYNLLAAGAMITVIPTLVIYLVLQRQFIAGLTLGANKG
ncbi:carbohydrate ABC transporter permease [Microbacterium xylanilyticum]